MADLTLEEMKANRKLWVEELRSGKYKQGKRQLLTRDSYCCLGVACLVAGKHDADMLHECNLGNLKDVRDFFGIRDYDGDFQGGSLVHLNDDANYTFRQIAEVIENPPPGLFVESAS